MVHEKPIYIGGELPKKEGAWTVCRFKREFGEKECGDVLRGVDTPMHTMISESYYEPIHWSNASWYI